MCLLKNVVCDTNLMITKINNWKNQIQQAVYDDYRKVASNTDFDNGTEYGYYDVFGLNDVPALKTVLSERYNLIHQALINEGYNCTVGISDLKNTEEIIVYPNPSSDYVNISTLNAPIESVTIIDVNGRIIY